MLGGLTFLGGMSPARRWESQAPVVGVAEVTGYDAVHKNPSHMRTRHGAVRHGPMARGEAGNELLHDCNNV